jgi:hypothetical protein
MAVVELTERLSRPVQTVKLVRRTSPQIFLAHNSLSRKLVERIESTIEKENVRVFIADREHRGTDLVKHIVKAMSDSDALFAVLTKNAMRKSIRDWMLFEMGLTKGVWNNLTPKVSSQYKIFGWKDSTIKLPKGSLIESISKFKDFKTRSIKSKDEMLKEMKLIAHDLSSVHLI